MNQEQLAKELLRLEKAKIPLQVKAKIEEFIDDIKIAGLSTSRQFFYAIRLRRIAQIIPEKFLDPTSADIKKVLARLMEGRKVKGSDNNKEYSDWEIENYKSTLKKFYHWQTGSENPECVKWIKPNNHPNRLVKPESMITQDEVDRLVNVLKNARDRAIVYALFDSGCRIGELLTLKNKDINFDSYGAILSVTGKTGYRRVRVVGNSISYMREWQNSHPSRENPESWFFCGMEAKNSGKQLEHANVYKFLRKGLKEARIERRIYPHLFRHTRATILASRVTEVPLESQMGWVHGSKMTQTYVHLSGRDQDNAILKAYGIEVSDETPIETERPMVCPRCKEPNDKKARFCWKCGMILDKTLTEEKLMKEAKEIEDSLMGSQVISDSTKKLISSFPPEFKDLIIETVLKEIIASPELSEKFRAEKH